MVSALDDDAEEIIVAGQGFQDKASFHRVVRNGSATESMRFVIAYFLVLLKFDSRSIGP